MKLLDRLEHRFRRYAVPNVTLGLIACQVVMYAVMFPTGGMEPGGGVERFTLVPRLVLAGEVWRLLTFLIVPPISNPLCAFFFWYMFYLMGTTLEQHWGAFRYNVFLLVGFLATVAAAFITPGAPTSNGFLEGSVFLAFAFLYPHFEFYLFFILPVKIKWLAMLTWAGYAYTVLFFPWSMKIAVLASVCNFFVFFGRDVLDRVRIGRRRMAFQAVKLTEKQRDFIHRCTVCGITDRTHPEMDFRYCSRCIGTRGYCSEHLRNHEHITTAEPTKS